VRRPRLLSLDGRFIASADLCLAGDYRERAIALLIISLWEDLDIA